MHGVAAHYTKNSPESLQRNVITRRAKNLARWLARLGIPEKDAHELLSFALDDGAYGLAEEELLQARELAFKLATVPEDVFPQHVRGRLRQLVDGIDDRLTAMFG